MWYKIIDNKKVFTDGKSVEIDGRIVFNATDEMLLADGWIVYVEPEPSDEQKLQIAKDAKLERIAEYDSSENVNAFSYGGVFLWIDKATRVGLVNAADAAIAVGKDAIEVGLDGVFVTLAPAAIKGMLYQLEMYALDCFNVTERHKAEVAELTTIAEVEAYDITQGYPEKLAF